MQQNQTYFLFCVLSINLSDTLLEAVATQGSSSLQFPRADKDLMAFQKFLGII